MPKHSINVLLYSQEKNLYVKVRDENKICSTPHKNDATWFEMETNDSYAYAFKYNNKYVCAEPSGVIVCNRPVRSFWESFLIDGIGVTSSITSKKPVKIQTLHHDHLLLHIADTGTLCAAKGVSSGRLFHILPQVEDVSYVETDDVPPTETNDAILMKDLHKKLIDSIHSLRVEQYNPNTHGGLCSNYSWRINMGNTNERCKIAEDIAELQIKMINKANTSDALQNRLDQCNIENASLKTTVDKLSHSMNTLTAENKELKDALAKLEKKMETLMEFISMKL